MSRRARRRIAWLGVGAALTLAAGEAAAREPRGASRRVTAGAMAKRAPGPDRPAPGPARAERIERPGADAPRGAGRVEARPRASAPSRLDRVATPRHRSKRARADRPLGTRVTADELRARSCAQRTVVRAGATYRGCGAAWFKREYRGGRLGYVRVNAPPGE